MALPVDDICSRHNPVMGNVLGSVKLQSDKPRAVVEVYRWMLVGLLLLSNCLYWSWRPGIINHDAPILSWLFFAVELLGVVWGFYFVAMSVRLSHRVHVPAPANVSADVFITTYNEPVWLVRRTVVAALAIRYPHTTWVLDDGARVEMAAMAMEMGCHYLSRTVNTDAKAGNLNNGLSRSSADFILVLDADHIPLPEMLDQTLGYFCDEKVALVQTPQEFYNFDSFQHMGDDRSRSPWCEHSLFHRVIQRERDLANAAMFSGSGAVLRRKALDDVGGFASGTVTEDMHTSVRLHAKGWHSVLHPQTLSGGLAPGDVRSFKRQRLRWAQGAMQVFVQENLFTNPGLTKRQRVAYLSHVFAHFAGWRTAFLAFFPSLVLLSGVSPLRVHIDAYLVYFVQYFLINWLVFEELARGHGYFCRTEVHNLARCIPAMAAVFSARKRRMQFRVTPKVPQEDSAHFVLFPWLVILCGVAGLLAAWCNVVMKPYTWPDVAAMSLWVLYSLGSAVSVLVISRRCRLKNGEETLFPVALSVDLCVLDAGNVIHQVDATGLASDRLVLCDPERSHLPDIGTMVEVSFFVNQHPWRLRGVISSCAENRVTVRWLFDTDRHAAEFAVDVVSRHLHNLSAFDRLDHESQVFKWGRLLLRRRATSTTLNHSKHKQSGAKTCDPVDPIESVCQ